MKTSFLILVSVLAFFTSASCSAKSTDNDKSTKVSKSENVEVYYFHFTRRCATCNAVQTVSKDAVTDLYGDKVSFSDFNLDEEDGAAKGKDLSISGQTLLIIAGDTRIDITNDGFMNARANPEKLKAIIKEKIDPLIE